MREFNLNPLHYVSLNGYSFDCCLMSTAVTLDTLQDNQMLDDFVEAKRGGICGKMGDGYINNGNGNGDGNSNDIDNGNNNINSNCDTWTKTHSNRSIWYLNANNLCGYAMMQKLPYKDFEYSFKSLDAILNTADDSDHGYYIVCDINYTSSCKERTEQLAIRPNK